VKAQGRYFVKSRGKGASAKRRKARLQRVVQVETTALINRPVYRWSADRMRRIQTGIKTAVRWEGKEDTSFPLVSSKDMVHFRYESLLWFEGDSHENTFSVTILPASEGSASRKRRKKALAWLAEVAGYANTCELCNAAERQGQGGVSLVRVSARKAKRHVSKLRRELLIRGEGVWRIQ